jgi:copper chaperone CopZ
MNYPLTLDFPIEGMACAACASRIETVPNRIEGVKTTRN